MAVSSFKAQEIKEVLDSMEEITKTGREHRSPPGSPGVGTADFVAGYDKGVDDALANVRSWLGVD